MTTVLDILSSPWAIEPERLQQIHAIYDARVRGEQPDFEAIEARLGRQLSNERQQAYEVRNGAALIPLRGVLGRRMNLMSNMSGGTSTELFARDVQAAVADPEVQSIVLMVDSPGGTVAGTQAAASVVMAARGTKPIAAMVEGTMASAAYWIGSAADVVVLDSTTAQVGSIGVVATHTDISKAEEAAGVKTTEIVAGSYKRIASQHGPLTEAGRKSIQDQVDYLYAQFVQDVAMQRGVSEEKVLSDMADGRVFIGQQAIDAGLADGVNTLDGVIALLNERVQSRSILPTATFSMTPEDLAAEWAAENPEAAAVLRAEGAAAETQRVNDVRAQLVPGHEALIEELASDGHTTGDEAARAIVKAERQVRASQAQERVSEAVAPLPDAPAPEGLEAKEQEPAPEINPHELAARAREIVDEAQAKGRSISLPNAVAQARRELTAA
jgi:signal peptide peptidase SppA